MLRPLALACLLPALPVQAQNWDVYSHDGGRGAGICPLDDERTGNFFCFLISCPPEGGALYLRVAFAGAAFQEAHPGLVIEVDGEQEAALTLDQVPTDADYDFGIRVDAERDAPLVEALSGGRVATLILGDLPEQIVQRVPLTGSRAAIERLPGLCDK